MTRCYCESLFKFTLYIGNKVPLLKDLHLYIIPHYATHWREIGVLLGLRKGDLDCIEHEMPTGIKCFCNKMLESWLQVDTTASWAKLYNVIDSAAVTGGQAVIKGDHSQYG